MAHSTQQPYVDTGYQHADPTVQPVHSESSPQPADTDGRSGDPTVQPVHSESSPQPADTDGRSGDPTVQPVHSESSPQPADTDGWSGDTTVERVYPGTTMQLEEVGCCCSDVTVETVDSESCVQLEETGCCSGDTTVQPVCDTSTQFADIHYQSEDVTVVPVHSDTVSQFEESDDGSGNVTMQQVYPGASIVLIETGECLPDDSDYTGNVDICETVEVEVSNNVDTDTLPDILSVQVPQVPECSCGDIEVNECIEMDATFGSMEMEVIVEEEEEQVEAEMESVEVLEEVEVSSVDVSVEPVSMPCADIPSSATIVEVAADTGIENSYIFEPAETSSMGVNAETVFRSCTESSPAKTVEGLSVEEDRTNPLSWEKCERTANAENSDIEPVPDSRYSSIAGAGAVVTAEESWPSRDTDCEEVGISVDLADTHQNADLNQKLPATEKDSGKQEETPHSETLLDYAFSLQQADQASPQPSQHPKAKNQTEDLFAVQHDNLRPDVPNKMKIDFPESCTAASENGSGNISSAVFPGPSEEVQSGSTEVEACCVESHVDITSGDQNAAKEPLYLKKTSARQMERNNEDYPNSTTIHLTARVSFETGIPTSSQTQKVLDISGDEEFLEHTAGSVESLETKNDNISTPADGVDRENRGEEGENKTVKYVEEKSDSCCGLTEKADPSKQGGDNSEQHREERETGWQKTDRDTLWGKQSVQKSKQIVMKDNQVQRSAEHSIDDVEKATEPTQAELEEKPVVVEEFPEGRCDLHSNKEHVQTERVITECSTKQDQEKMTENATSARGRKDEADKGISNTGVTDKNIPEQTETAKTVRNTDMNKETEMEQDLNAVKYSTNTSLGDTGANSRTIDKQKGLDDHEANIAEDTQSAEKQDIESDKSSGTETEWQSVEEENSSVSHVASEINSTQKEKSKHTECSKTKCLSEDQIGAAEERTDGVVSAVDTQFNKHLTETVRTALETCANEEKEVRVDTENTIENMGTMYCEAEDASCADQRTGSEQTGLKQIVEEQRAEKAGSGRQNIIVDRKHIEMAEMDLGTAEDGVKRLVRTEMKCVPQQVEMKKASPETNRLASLEENCAETNRDKSDSSRTVEQQETETEMVSEVERTAEQTMDTKITATERISANGEHPNTAGLVTDGRNATVNLMDAAKTAVSHSASVQNTDLTDEPSTQVHIASSRGFHKSYSSLREVAATNPRSVPVNITSESSTGRGEDATGREEQPEIDDTTETKTDESEIVPEQTVAQRSITQDMNTTETIAKTGGQHMKRTQISASIECTADKDMPAAGVAVERGSTSSQVLDISDSVVEKLHRDTCTKTDNINPAQDNENICFKLVGIMRMESINSISKQSEDSTSDRSEEQTCSVKSQCSTKSLDSVSLGKDVPKIRNCKERNRTKLYLKNTDVLTKPKIKTVDCAYNKSIDEENPKINTHGKDNAIQRQPATPMECDREPSPSPQQIAQLASCTLREKPRDLHKETIQDCYKTDHSIDRLEEGARGVGKDDDGLFSDQCSEVNDEFLSADLGKNHQNSTDNQKQDTSGLMQNDGSADRNDNTNNHIADTEKDNLSVEGKDEKNNGADVEKEKPVDVKHFENTDVLQKKVTETMFLDETNKKDDECERNSKDRVKCIEMCDHQIKDKWRKVGKHIGENLHGTDRCVGNTTTVVIMNVSTNDDRSKESDVQNSDTATRAVEEDGCWHRTSQIKDKMERSETDRNTDSENACSTGDNMKTTDTRTSEENFEEKETNVSMWTDRNSHLVDQDDVQVRCIRNNERCDSIAEQISNRREEQFNTHDNCIHDKNNENINIPDKQNNDAISEEMETTNDNLTCPKNVESDMSNTTTSPSKDKVQARAMSFNKCSNTGDDGVDNKYNDKFISKENENGSSQEASMLTLLPSRADKNPGNDSADMDPHLSDASSSKSAETLTTKQNITQPPTPSTREQEDVSFCEISAAENRTLECYKVSTTEDTLTSSCAMTKWDTMKVSTVEQKPQHLSGISVSKLKLGSPCDPLVSEQENVSPGETSASKQESSSSENTAQQRHVGIEIISTSEQESVNFENASLVEKESVNPAQTSKAEQKSIYFQETSGTQRELHKPEEIPADKSKSVLAAEHDSFWHEQTLTVRENCVRDEETSKPGHENVSSEQTLMTTQHSIRSEKTSRFQLEVPDPRETIVIEQESVNPEDPSVTAHESPSPENASITQQDSISPVKDSSPKVYVIPEEIPRPQHDTFSLKETTTEQEFTNPESITTVQEFVNIDKTSAAEQNFVNTKDTPAKKQELNSHEKVLVTEQEFFCLGKTSTGFQESSRFEETSTTEHKNGLERKSVNVLGSDKPHKTSRTQQQSVIPEETSTDQQEPVNPKGNSTNQQKCNRPEDTLTTQKWPEDSSTAQQESFNLQQTLITEQEDFSAGNISRIQQDSTNTEEISTIQKTSVIPERTSITQQEYEKTSTTLHKPIILKETSAAKQQSAGPDEIALAQKESFSPEETLTTEEAHVSLTGTSTTLQKFVLYKETSIPELQSATTEETSATQNESVNSYKTSTTQQQYFSPENTSATLQKFVSYENTLTAQNESDSREETSKTGQENVNPTEASVDLEETSRILLESVSLGDPTTAEQKSVSSKETITEEFPVIQQESVTTEETSAAQRESIIFKETSTQQKSVNLNRASTTQKILVDPEEPSTSDQKFSTPGYPSPTEQQHVCPRDIPKSQKESISPGKTSTAEQESFNPREILQIQQRSGLIFKPQHEPAGFRGSSTTEQESVIEQSSTTEQDSIREQSSTTEQESVIEQSSTTEQDSIREQSSTTEQDSIREQNSTTEQDSVIEQSSTTEQDSIREQSSTTEQDSIREQSSTTEQDSIREQSSATEQESVIEQSSTTEQDSIREQSSITEWDSVTQQNSTTEHELVSSGETLIAEHESIDPEESSTSQQESINKETSKTIKESSMPEDISTAQLYSVRCEETSVIDDVPISSEEALVTHWRSTDPGEKSLTEEDSVSSEDAPRTEQELCYVYEASAPEHKLVITLRTHSGKTDVKGPVHKRYEKNEEYGSDSDTKETENTDDLDSEKNAELYNTTTDSCDSFQDYHTNCSVNQTRKRKYSSILSDNPNTDYKQIYHNKSSTSDADDKSSTDRDSEHEGLSLKERNGAQDFDSTLSIKRTKRPQESDSAKTSFQSSLAISSFTSVSSMSSNVVPLSQNARKHSKKRRRKSRKTKFKKQTFEYSSPTRDETQTFSCRSCSETFTNKLQYWRHERQHSFNHCFVCEVCGARLTSDEDGYRRHLQQHSRRELLHFSCRSCGQPFSSKEQLDQHSALCRPPSSPHTTPPTPAPAMLVEPPSPPLREPSCMRIVLSKTGKTSRKRKRRSRNAEEGLSLPEPAVGDQGCPRPQEAGKDASSGWASVGKVAGRSAPNTADHREIPTSPLTSAAGRKSLRKKFPSRSRCSCCPDFSSAVFPFRFSSQHGCSDKAEKSRDTATMLKTVSERETVSLTMSDAHHLNGGEKESVLRQTVMDPVPEVSIERFSFANNCNLNGLNAKESVVPQTVKTTVPKVDTERFSFANNNGYNNNNSNNNNNNNNNSSSSSNNDLNGHSKDNAMPPTLMTQACPAFPLKDCSVQVWRLPQDVCFNGGLTMSGELCHRSQASSDSELTSWDHPDSCEVPSNVTPAPPLPKPCSVRLERMPLSWLRSLASHSVLKLPASSDSTEVLPLTAQRSQFHMLALEENPERRDSTKILKKNVTRKWQQQSSSSSSSSQSKKRPTEQTLQRPAKIYRTASEKMLPKHLASSHAQKRRRWRENQRVGSGDQTPSLPKTEQRETLEHRGVFHRRYPCVLCERVFLCSSDMQVHVNTHLGKKTQGSGTHPSLPPLPAELVEESPQPCVCHRCGFLASDSADLLRHMALHPAKTHACQHCWLTFRTLETLRRHMKAHSPSAQTYYSKAARGGQRRRKKRGGKRGITTPTKVVGCA